MEYLTGGFMALAAATLANALGFAGDRSFYPTVAIVIATYYVLFAAMGASEPALWKESIIGIGFGALAVFGFRSSLWWVAATLVGHGVFDFFHPALIDNPAVPAWWPGFCLAFDVVLSAPLAFRLFSERKRLTSQPGLR